MGKVYKCKYCGKEFVNKMQLGGHSSRCKAHPNYEKNKQKIHNNALHSLQIMAERYKEKHPESYRMILVQKKCERCGNIFYRWVKETQIKNISRFCSRHCANKRTYTIEYRNKISETSRGRTKNKKRVERICMVCGKKYIHIKGAGTTKLMCSKKCSNYYRTHRKQFLTQKAIEKLSISGKKSSSIQSDNRRSKNEIAFCKMCESCFNNVEHNKNIFNGWDADIILNDFKIAILWNGPWHYKEISKKISLKQIQNRDKIKLEEIKKCGWLPYIIKDMGRYNNKFVEQEFERFKKYVEDLQ